MANIYVIDDDNQLLRMVGLMLERGGHTATLIDNPKEGLAKIREAKPDVVVLDVMMPNMSGHDVCREIRADNQLAHLPILILTARAQAIDREAALKSGADDYLSKPVNAQELLEKIDELLTHHISSSTEKAAFIVSFMGMRGGIGRTTLAVNLAAALRRISQEEICLVELTPSGGQIGMHLRIQPRSSWAELPEADELDWDILKKHLTIHPTGLRLLASPSMLVPPNLPTEEKTAKVLQILGEKMAAVIIDLPAVFNHAYQVVIAQSDAIFHIVNPDVISVQLALQTKQTLSALGITPKYAFHVLNQVRPESQLNAPAVERALKARLVFDVEYDSNQARALAQGVPLAYSSEQSPLPVVIRRMAEGLWKRTHQEQ